MILCTSWSSLLRLFRFLLQHVLHVLDHDSLHILELVVEIVQVPPAPSVTVRLLGFLDVRVKLDEAVRPGCGVDLVSILAVELSREGIQKTVSLLFAKLSLRQSEETRLLLNDIVEKKISIACLQKAPLGTILTQGLEEPLGLVLILENVLSSLFILLHRG